MFTKRSGSKVMFLALVAVLLLSLPLAAAAAETTNGITSPKDGATVSGKADVKGYASDPSFAKWQLDVLPGGDANAAIFLAVGDKPGEFSYNMDTTAFPNGEHALRLRVVRADSNYDEYINKFTIANGQAKPAAAPAAAAKDIVGDGDCAGQFKTLVAAVQAAGLVEALQGKGRSRCLRRPMRRSPSYLREPSEGLSEGSEGAEQHSAVPRGAGRSEGCRGEGWHDCGDPPGFAGHLQADGRQGDDQRRQHRCDRRDGFERRDPRDRLGDSARRLRRPPRLPPRRCPTASRA